LTSWVRQEVADAGQFLQRQPPAGFDLLFLDAHREHYAGWWPALRDVLAPGGLLVVDNAVSHAAELEPFLAGVRAEPGWRSVVAPVGKGEFIALKPLA
jgi:predicted O-methyltransferase YrrM